MENNDNHLERIHQYLRDELSAKERSVFEADLAQDPAFQATFDEEKKLVEGIRAITKERRAEKAKLEKIHNEFVQKSVPKSGKRKWLYRALVAAAAVILIAMLAKVFWKDVDLNDNAYSGGDSTEKYFQEKIPVWEIKTSPFEKTKTSDVIQLEIKKHDEDTTIYKLKNGALTIFIKDNNVFAKGGFTFYKTKIEGIDRFFLKAIGKKYELKVNEELSLQELNDPELSNLFD